MEIIKNIENLQPILKQWHSKALVPTMGNLHQGHISLMHLAKQHAEKVIATIFVNPLQFNNPDDLDTYPRTEAEDIKKLEENNVDMVFIPSIELLYPQGLEKCTKVEVPEVTNILCGAFRQGHFTGVATIISKLFHLIPADIAIFGEKDWQQLQVIKKLVQDLNFNIKIVSGKTIREASGLALSSRNQRLTSEEKQKAALLYQTLQQASEGIQQGESAEAMEAQARKILFEAQFQIEYFTLLTPELKIPGKEDTALIWLSAVWLGKTRLIDNHAFIKINA